jgi:hypothetical protein
MVMFPRERPSTSRAGMLESEEDREAERRICAYLQRAWNCTISRFGEFSTIDRFIRVGDRLAAMLEIKGHPGQRVDEYPHVYIDVDKWEALVAAEKAHHVPSIWLCYFADRVVGWAYAHEIDGSRSEIVGRKDRGRPTDQHPAIRVPIGLLKPVLARKVERAYM